MAREPPGPAWDNRSAREAGSRSERRFSLFCFCNCFFYRLFSRKRISLCTRPVRLSVTGKAWLFLRPQEGVQVGMLLRSPRPRGGGCRRPAQPRDPAPRSPPREASRPRPAPRRGSSRSDEAYARCAARPSVDASLARGGSQACWRRTGTGIGEQAEACDRLRREPLPPTSSPTTTSLQRRAGKSRSWLAISRRPVPREWAHERGMRGRPPASTSMRRASASGTSRFAAHSRGCRLQGRAGPTRLLWGRPCDGHPRRREPHRNGSVVGLGRACTHSACGTQAPWGAQ